MSRTKRRINAEWDKWDDCPDWKYHSDNQITMQQVPKWYKDTFCRRPYRSKSKRTLHKAIQTDLEPVMPIDKSKALYYW